MAAGMTDWSEAETRALATRAALGAGLPPAQAALYGASAGHFLARGGADADLVQALSDPSTNAVITQIATLPAGPVALPNHVLSAAICTSLPGRVEGGVYAPDQPKPHAAPRRVTVAAALQTCWQDFAQRTYVPDSATSHAGAGGADD